MFKAKINAQFLCVSQFIFKLDSVFRVLFYRQTMGVRECWMLMHHAQTNTRFYWSKINRYAFCCFAVCILIIWQLEHKLNTNICVKWNKNVYLFSSSMHIFNLYALREKCSFLPFLSSGRVTSVGCAVDYECCFCNFSLYTTHTNTNNHITS